MGTCSGSTVEGAEDAVLFAEVTAGTAAAEAAVWLESDEVAMTGVVVAEDCWK